MLRLLSFILLCLILSNSAGGNDSASQLHSSNRGTDSVFLFCYFCNRAKISGCGNKMRNVNFKKKKKQVNLHLSLSQIEVRQHKKALVSFRIIWEKSWIGRGGFLHWNVLLTWKWNCLVYQQQKQELTTVSSCSIRKNTQKKPTPHTVDECKDENGWEPCSTEEIPVICNFILVMVIHVSLEVFQQQQLLFAVFETHVLLLKQSLNQHGIWLIRLCLWSQQTLSCRIASGLETEGKCSDTFWKEKDKLYWLQWNLIIR